MAAAAMGHEFGVRANGQLEMGLVYTMLLENECLYVGWTARDNAGRTMEHYGAAGAKWTRAHKPVEVIEQVPGTIADEDRITLECMRKYGWQRVRGGRWCAVDMRYPPKELMPAMPKTIDEIKTGTPMLCARCGRNNHTEDTCVAISHLSGKTLRKSKRSATPSKKRSFSRKSSSTTANKPRRERKKKTGYSRSSGAHACATCQGPLKAISKTVMKPSPRDVVRYVCETCH